MAVEAKIGRTSSVVRGDCCRLLLRYSFILLSLSLPKSEWLYCFVRGLRPEIREHAILQQPPDFESALNIAKLKELVTLSYKSNKGQEEENFEELQCNPAEEEIKQSVGDEINVWSTDFQNN